MITKIGIQNFKAFAGKHEVKIGTLNLLTGINGRGKSSFLQSLLLISQSIRNSDQHSPMYLLTNDEWVQLGDFKDLINIHHKDEGVKICVTTDDAIDNNYELLYQGVENDRYVAELRSMLVNGVETFSEAGGYRHATESGERIAPVFSGYTPLLKLQNLYYVAAEREGALESEDKLSGIRFANVDSRGHNVLNIIYHQGKEFQRQIEKYLSQIFDGATFKIAEDDRTIRLFMDSVDNGDDFRPVNVGYGYRYILTLLTVGLMAKQGDLVVIENPEAHLHPSAQSAIMHFICEHVISKDVQVFLETHSDHIVNAALLAVRKNVVAQDKIEVIFFYRTTNDTEANIINLEVTSKGRVKNPPKNFCDQYALDLRELMGYY